MHSIPILLRSVLPATVFLLLAVVIGLPMATDAAEAKPVLRVPSEKRTLHLATPLPGDADLKSGDSWQLVEIDRPDVTLPAQLVPAIAADGTVGSEFGRLVADVPPRQGAEGPRQFRLEPAKAISGDAAKAFRFEDVNDKSLKLVEGDCPVLVYNHGVITCPDVPEADHRRSRGCYIHPVWGLHGEVLTDDFSKDHYHHHGIFWTWPHVKIGDEQYDLWAGSKIRQQFVRWIHRQTGPVAAVLAVENGWFVGQQKVMIERVWMRCHRVAADTRSLDLEFAWIPVDRPITLQGAGGKSYGGLTARFAVADAGKAVIRVPDGRTSEDLYETRLPWADLAYPFAGAPAASGAAVFIHPDHPDYPPTWLTRHYGPLCVGWPGVEAQTFEPDKPIRAGYRIFIHKSELEVDALKQAYHGYVTAAKVNWE